MPRSVDGRRVPTLMNVFQRLRAMPPREWSDTEVAGVLLAMSKRGKSEGMDAWFIAVLAEASRRLGERSS